MARAPDLKFQKLYLVTPGFMCLYVSTKFALVKKDPKLAFSWGVKPADFSLAFDAPYKSMF